MRHHRPRHLRRPKVSAQIRRPGSAGQRIIMASLQKVLTGLAMSFPLISGALLWLGRNIEVFTYQEPETDAFVLWQDRVKSLPPRIIPQYVRRIYRSRLRASAVQNP